MDLATTNSQTFVWTVSLAAWMPILDLTTLRFRMQIRAAADDPNVALSFDSASGTSAAGTCTLEPSSGLLTMRAPAAAVSRVQRGSYVYELVGIAPVPSSGDPLIKTFAEGAIVFSEGVSR